MDAVIASLSGLYPSLTYIESDTFCWSPETREVMYVHSSDDETFTWSVLHETGHALLEHSTYKADFELIRLEVAAWEKAKEIALERGIFIDESHIQDCIDTYRDWLYGRSICPSCDTKCLQQSDLSFYRCFNCHEQWRVTPSRFCRAYRATKRTGAAPRPVFTLTSTK